MCDASGRPPSSSLADLSREELAIWAGFLQTHAALARELDADLRTAHGLPLTDFEILLWLANRPCQEMRMAALADTVLLSPSGLSRAVERLETRGLVRTAGATHAAGIRRRFVDRLTSQETRLLTAIWDRLQPGSQETCAWPETLASETDEARIGVGAGKTRRTRRNDV